MFGRLILGGAQLSSTYGITNHMKKIMSMDAAASFIKIAAEKGFCAIDIAEDYGELVSKINSINSGLEVHSKVNILEYTALQTSLERHSKIENLKVLYIHDADRCNLKDVNIQASIEAFKKYCTEKKISFGLSIYDAKTLLDFIKFGITPDLVQYPKNVISAIDPIGEICKKNNIKVTYRSLFLQGILAADNITELPYNFRENLVIKKFYKWADRSKMSRWQICLLDNSVKDADKVLGFANLQQMEVILADLDQDVSIEYPNHLKTNNQNLIDPRKW